MSTGEEPATDSRALPQGSVVGNYAIHGVLGTGGFGITYLARHQALGRKTALKECLPPALATRDHNTTVRPLTDALRPDFEWAVKRFIDEARTLAGFKHPGIVTVHDVFEAAGTGYMASEFVEGQTLGQWARAFGGKLPASALHRVLEAVLEALEVIHEARVIHRDIKPSNILVTPSGEPVLIDFGAARQSIEGQTRTMTAVLTPGYAPIEQYATGEHAGQGPWTDLYALAATIHALLRGDPPEASSLRVFDDRYQPMATDAALLDYPPTLRVALDAALAPNPKDRPRSVAEFRAILEGHRAPASASEATIPAGPSAASPSPAGATDSLASDATRPMAPAHPVREPAASTSPTAPSAAAGAESRPHPDPGEAPDAPARTPTPPATPAAPPRKAGFPWALVGTIVLLSILAATAYIAWPWIEGLRERVAEREEERREENQRTRNQAASEEEPEEDEEPPAAEEEPTIGGEEDFVIPADGPWAGVRLPGEEPRHQFLRVPPTEPDKAWETIEDGIIRIGSTPSGAYIFEGDRLIGRTPMVLRDRAAGEFTFELNLDGYEDTFIEGYLAPGEEAVFNANLVGTDQKAPNGDAANFNEPEDDRVPSGYREVALPDGEMMYLVWIPPGSFTMGSPANERGRDSDERPYRVEITKGYWLGKYEVTQAQWMAVMGTNPSEHEDSGLEAPVENVSWDEAVQFCQRLNDLAAQRGELPEGYHFALPTEAQWEYACRAGTTTRYGFGDDAGELHAYANYADRNANLSWADSRANDAYRYTAPVGTYEANLWGLYDMHGNVWEWCADGYLSRYPGPAAKDPEGPRSGTERVKRGGSWNDRENLLRSAFRGTEPPRTRADNLGFRVALRPR